MRGSSSSGLLEISEILNRKMLLCSVNHEDVSFIAERKLIGLEKNEATSESASLEDSGFHTIGLGTFSIGAYEEINSTGRF